MTKTIDVEFEMSAARTMLAELEEYLGSDVLYWQTASNALGDRMPKLTIGGLLEALLRAEAAGAPDAPALRSSLQRIKSGHLYRYLDRAERETRSRLDAWAWYLDDYARSAADAAGYYSREVRARLKAELLLSEVEPHQRGRAERARADALDERVRAAFAPGEFVLDERLKAYLPADRFWWLYGRLHNR
ncbi:MAG TPA: hypothetical protein VFL17_23830 [Anaerolineae bacterium]|nr:hypothetical protein [Anaerolineae bacterium]